MKYTTVPEGLLDATIGEMKDRFPYLKKIVVYEADTKDIIDIEKSGAASFATPVNFGILLLYFLSFFITFGSDR